MMSAQPENLQITVEFVLTARKENMLMREDQLHAKIAKKEGTQRQKQANGGRGQEWTGEPELTVSQEVKSATRNSASNLKLQLL